MSFKYYEIFSLGCHGNQSSNIKLNSLSKCQSMVESGQDVFKIKLFTMQDGHQVVPIAALVKLNQ